MKCKTLINLIVLGILAGMPSLVTGREKKDSLVLERIYEFKAAHPIWPDSVKDNIYMKYRFNVERRNPTLWLIPTLYVMAKDEREYIRESYNDITYLTEHRLEVNRQLLSGTIRHNRRAMPTLRDLMTPNIYDATLYDGHVLSPFNRHNRRYYKYTQSRLSDGTTRLDFKPKLYNTQLLSGYAIVNSDNGHIIRTVLNGEFDMISYRTEIRQSDEDWPLPTPAKCTTAATFNFFGNRISSILTTDYNCPPLPDSIDYDRGRELMDSLRTSPLSEQDKLIYAHYDEAHQVDTTTVVEDTVPRKQNVLKKIFWDTIGETLVTPIRAESKQVYMRLSPIINPLYLRYSDSKGLSYKMRLRSQYTFTAHRYLTADPTFGYNFKIKQFYYDIPIRMTYNPKRNGYAEVIFANGNRISNSSVEATIKQIHGDSLDFSGLEANKFNNTYLRVFNNIMLFNWIDIESGVVFHHRGAVNKGLMQQYGMPTEYRSFAPMLGLKITPWKDGPLISIDWERGIKGVNKSNIDYERWELDGQWKHRMAGLRILNMRMGYGIYSRRAQNYFVDFANFRETNLPEGWDDEWTGDFQLLNGEDFTSSNYYIRANASYESPMMLATWIPYLGKYIEKERFYLSGVLLEHCRPYFELGYGFSNRYLSAAVFTSFKNIRFQEIGFKFEFELFRRW